MNTILAIEDLPPDARLSIPNLTEFTDQTISVEDGLPGGGKRYLLRGAQ